MQVVRQRDIGVLGPLAAMDMDESAIAIDIRNPQGQGLSESQAAGVDRRQVDVIVEGRDLAGQGLDLDPAQYRGQAFFGRRLDDLQQLNER